MATETKVTSAKSFVLERRQLLNTLSVYDTFRVLRVRHGKDAEFKDSRGRECVTYYFGECVKHESDDHARVFFDRNAIMRRGFGILGSVIPNAAQASFKEPCNDFVANVPRTGSLIFGMRVVNMSVKEDTRERVPYRLATWCTCGEQFNTFIQMLRGKVRIKAHELKRRLRVPNAAGPDDLYAMIMFIVIGKVQLFVDEQAKTQAQRTMELSADPLLFIVNIARLLESDAMKERILEVAPEMAHMWADTAPPPLEADTTFETEPERKCSRTDANAYKDYETLVIPYEADEDVWHAGFRVSYKKRKLEREEYGAAAAAVTVPPFQDVFVAPVAVPATPPCDVLASLREAFQSGAAAAGAQRPATPPFYPPASPLYAPVSQSNPPASPSYVPVDGTTPPPVMVDFEDL